ncbi:MAG: hypothetical protein AMS25_12730 [Gemmatimonas sp. SM23_52]|nr:MAG: hypothetical protein AMS25_12730 [Gemmatimonas sp. SM23_52]
MSRHTRRLRDPDQFDLFEPHHERCEDRHGIYLQFLIAPPTELGEPGPWAAEAKTRSDGEVSSVLPSS